MSFKLQLYDLFGKLGSKGPENIKLSTDDIEAFKEYEDMELEARGLTLYY